MRADGGFGRCAGRCCGGRGLWLPGAAEGELGLIGCGGGLRASGCNGEAFGRRAAFCWESPATCLVENELRRHWYSAVMAIRRDGGGTKTTCGVSDGRSRKQISGPRKMTF